MVCVVTEWKSSFVCLDCEHVLYSNNTIFTIICHSIKITTLTSKSWWNDRQSENRIFICELTVENVRHQRNYCQRSLCQRFRYLLSLILPSIRKAFWKWNWHLSTIFGRFFSTSIAYAEIMETQICQVYYETPKLLHCIIAKLLRGKTIVITIPPRKTSSSIDSIDTSKSCSLHGYHVIDFGWWIILT